MSLSSTPRSNRVHIAFFGRRNAGKSSLINVIADQDVALVSPLPGTTTDPVYKAMELHGAGPVVLIDTPGIDDTGDLGKARVSRALRVLRKTDVAVLVVDATQGVGEAEKTLLADLLSRKVPVVGALTKWDLVRQDPLQARQAREQSASLVPLTEVSALDGTGISGLVEQLKEAAGEGRLDAGQAIVGDLLSPGDVVILAIPIDIQAPKGRLILPQVQTLRDILDHDAIAVMSKVSELEAAINRAMSGHVFSADRQSAAPGAPVPGQGSMIRMVITDSQVFNDVGRIIPESVPLTSFSILFARHKGDLNALVDGALALDELKAGDEVLIAEACTHHPVEDDIGKVKIPAWLQKKVGGGLKFSWVRGGDFPQDLSRFKVIIHCGGCMLNRQEMLFRIGAARYAGVPITNYGMAIAYSHGILERALAPFGYDIGLPEDSCEPI